MLMELTYQASHCPYLLPSKYFHSQTDFHSWNRFQKIALVSRLPIYVRIVSNGSVREELPV